MTATAKQRIILDVQHAAQDRIDRTGRSPKALSENSALARLDAQRSTRAMYDALRAELGGLPERRLLELTTLIETAMADEYESGYASGYQSGYGVGRTDERYGRPCASSVSR